MRAKEIRELVKIVEESIIGELEITYWWGRKVRISKNVSSSTPYRSGGMEIVTTSGQSQGGHIPAPITSTSINTGSPVEKAAPASNLVEIKAPMVGTYYRAPAPESDPYVREGDMIAPGKVLCIIEAMKLMNEIEAEMTGKIVKILVENGQPVEYNQPLFLLEPGF